MTKEKEFNLSKEIHKFVKEYIKGNMDEQIYLEGCIKEIHKEFIKIIIDDIESFKTPTYNFKFLDKIKENIKKRGS